MLLQKQNNVNIETKRIYNYHKVTLITFERIVLFHIPIQYVVN